MHSFAMQRQAGCELRRLFILIAATIVAFALLWHASLRTAVARAAFLILTCVGCIAIGFVLPVAPIISARIGSAFWAGLVATAGVGLSDELLNRIEMREFGAALTTSLEKTRPPA